MKLSILISLILGSFTVFQAGINRMVLTQKGLSYAVILNGAVLLFVAILIFLPMLTIMESVPDIMRLKSSSPFRWWYIAPGIMGFCLVFFLPIMFKNLGAFTTILALLVGQIVASISWDFFLLGQAINISRVIGVVLAISGAYLSYKPLS